MEVALLAIIRTFLVPKIRHFGPVVKQQCAEWHLRRRMQFLQSQCYRRYNAGRLDLATV
jgi:hypothetical protein